MADLILFFVGLCVAHNHPYCGLICVCMALFCSPRVDCGCTDIHNQDCKHKRIDENV